MPNDLARSHQIKCCNRCRQGGSVSECPFDDRLPIPCKLINVDVFAGRSDAVTPRAVCAERVGSLARWAGRELPESPWHEDARLADVADDTGLVHRAAPAAAGVADPRWTEVPRCECWSFALAHSPHYAHRGRSRCECPARPATGPGGGRDRKRSPAWGTAHQCRVARHCRSALFLTRYSPYLQKLPSPCAQWPSRALCP